MYQYLLNNLLLPELHSLSVRECQKTCNGKISVFHLGPKHFVIIHSHIQFANPVTWTHLDGHFLNRYGYWFVSPCDKAQSPASVISSSQLNSFYNKEIKLLSKLVTVQGQNKWGPNDISPTPAALHCYTSPSETIKWARATFSLSTQMAALK